MKKYITQIIVFATCSIFCGFILVDSFLQYSNNQHGFELHVQEVAERIRSNEVKLTAEQVADLLIATSARDVEKSLVSFYVNISIISITFSLFVFSLGFYQGNKKNNNNEKE